MLARNQSSKLSDEDTMRGKDPLWVNAPVCSTFMTWALVWLGDILLLHAIMAFNSIAESHSWSYSIILFPISLDADHRIASLTSELTTLRAHSAEEKQGLACKISALEAQALEHQRALESSVQFSASLQGQMEAITEELQGKVLQLSASSAHVLKLEQQILLSEVTHSQAMQAAKMQTSEAEAAHIEAMNKSEAKLSATKLSLQEALTDLEAEQASVCDLKQAMDMMKAEHAGVISSRDQLLEQISRVQEDLQELRKQKDEADMRHNVSQVCLFYGYWPELD